MLQRTRRSIVNVRVFEARHVISFLLIASVIALSALTSRHSSLPAADVREITAQEAQALMAVGAVVVDVRDQAVSGRAHLPGALLIPIEVLEARIEKLQVAKTADIVVYCGDGSTVGPRAAGTLNRSGYTKAVNLKSGFQGWSAAGLPIAQN
jgi:rhodanese-related sulfurtransferase